MWFQHKLVRIYGVLHDFFKGFCPGLLAKLHASASPTVLVQRQWSKHDRGLDPALPLFCTIPLESSIRKHGSWCFSDKGFYSLIRGL